MTDEYTIRDQSKEKAVFMHDPFVVTRTYYSGYRKRTEILGRYASRAAAQQAIRRSLGSMAWQLE